MEMPLEEFKRLKKSQKSAKPSGLLSEPISEHLAFIPKQQRSKVLVMTATELPMPTMPTAFIGTIQPNYTNELWKDDIYKWSAYFQDLGLNQPTFEIKLLPLRESTNIMDSADAISKIEEMLDLANQLPAGEMIRIVHLGTSYSNFLYEAISYLLKEWKEPGGALRVKKQLQFITSGDTKNRDLCDFCHWLCISGVCQYVAFYNTTLYHPFGYCDSQYIAKKNE